MNRDLRKRLEKLEAALRKKNEKDRQIRIVWRKARKPCSNPERREAQVTSEASGIVRES